MFGMMGITAAAQETDSVNTSQAAEAQNIPTVSHTVQMGETVMLICKKYVVSPDDIYKLNPEAVDGLTPGMVLMVPAEKKVVAHKAKRKPVDSSITSHTKKEEREQ